MRCGIKPKWIQEMQKAAREPVAHIKQTPPRGLFA
jgi:hypothetical protein